MAIKYIVVEQSELGANCWLPARFIEGQRCPRVTGCRYPEKRDCKAVSAEVDYLTHKLVSLQEIITLKIADLILMKGVDAGK